MASVCDTALGFYEALIGLFNPAPLDKGSVVFETLDLVH